MPKRERLTDDQILSMLDLRDHEGLMAATIGQRFGMTKKAVIGLFDRIRAADAQVADACVKKTNQDGGMKRKWWAR